MNIQKIYIKFKQDLYQNTLLYNILFWDNVLQSRTINCIIYFMQYNSQWINPCPNEIESDMPLPPE